MIRRKITHDIIISIINMASRCRWLTHLQSIDPLFIMIHGSLNVPIEHHPTIRYMVYNGGDVQYTLNGTVTNPRDCRWTHFSWSEKVFTLQFSFTLRPCHIFRAWKMSFHENSIGDLQGQSPNPGSPTPEPIGSMYAIYGNIYHQYTPNVSIYTSTMDPMGRWSTQFRRHLWTRSGSKRRAWPLARTRPAQARLASLLSAETKWFCTNFPWHIKR